MVKGTKRKVKFKVTELLNDMKVLSYIAGELSNAAAYFSTFANVRYKDCTDFSKFFGVENKHFWKPFPYSKRILNDEKAIQKKESLDKTNLAKLTKHNQLTSSISNQLKSRPMKFLLIGKFVDCAKAEPFQLKNNTIKERFIHLFKICVSQSNLKQFKYFKEIPKGYLFINYNYNFLSEKIIRWYNENSGKIEKDFTFSFRGKESLMYLRNFPRLILMLFSNIADKNVLKRLLQVHYQSLDLRKLLSYSVGISDVIWRA